MGETNTNKKILVVEDESALLFALKAELSSSGFEVDVASDGEEGIRKIRNEKPDLVILDLLLPKKDGFEVLEDLNKEGLTKEIPVMVISNLGEKKNVERAMKAGAVDYLIKTENSLEGIIKKIKGVLEKNETSN